MGETQKTDKRKRGPEHPHWKGGTKKTPDGRVLILTPEWFTGAEWEPGYVPRAEVVVCQTLGLTEIPAGYLVHHKDLDEGNDDPKNLDMIAVGDHHRLHAKLRPAGERKARVFREEGGPKVGYHTPELDVIFWARVRKKDLDECWPYIGKSRAANPKVRQTFQGVVASRYAYEAAFGPIPEGARVCHTCPGGNCCNPGHLYSSSYPSRYEEVTP